MFASGIVSFSFTTGVESNKNTLQTVVSETISSKCQQKNINFSSHIGGTELEGDWDAIMAVLGLVRDNLLAAGAVTVSAKFNLHTRSDRIVTLNDEMKEIELEYQKLQ
ncbi:hypothetical protein BDR26DRAFT_856018, partial [Obelidium mucronatum]